MEAQIVTANRLIDGLVVYFTADDTWSHWIADAHMCTTESDIQSTLSLAQASVADNEVVDAYLIDVRNEGSTIKPVRYREIIRAKGPSINVLPDATMVPSETAPLAFVNGL